MTTEPPPGSRLSPRRHGLPLLLLCVLLGCAAGTPRVASDLEAEVPPELRADYLSFATNCNKCHDLERPLTAHISDVHHWDLYVAKMMRTAGSSISAVESPKILRFLYWYTERRQRLANEAKQADQGEEKREAGPPEVALPEPPSPPEAALAVSPSEAVTPETPDSNQGPQVGNEGDGAP